MNNIRYFFLLCWYWPICAHSRTKCIPNAYILNLYSVGHCLFRSFDIMFLEFLFFSFSRPLTPHTHFGSLRRLLSQFILEMFVCRLRSFSCLLHCVFVFFCLVLSLCFLFCFTQTVLSGFFCFRFIVVWYVFSQVVEHFLLLSFIAFVFVVIRLLLGCCFIRIVFQGWLRMRADTDKSEKDSTVEESEFLCYSKKAENIASEMSSVCCRVCSVHTQLPK